MSLFNIPDLKAKGRAATFGTFKTTNSILNESVQNFSLFGTYDIFLSHSIADAEVILGLRNELKSKGYSVYVDWIEDPNLNRANVTKETAIYIQDRMKTCKSLLYATSISATSSKWMPWELGFFDGFKKKVAIIPITSLANSTDEFKGQEYLGIYPYVVVTGSTLYIHNTVSSYIDFDRWLRN
jgi:hypothetical protein